MNKKQCIVCGKEFEAVRCDALYCSDRCSKRARRCYLTPNKLENPVPQYELKDGELEVVVLRAHNAAADLSRCSRMVPPPLCFRLARAAQKIENVLKREDL